jgi:hypothetical protein
VPVGDRQPIELLEDEAAWNREPIRIANEEFGHNVEYDGVTHERYTCTRCGNAVLRVGCNIYGSAVRETCEEGQAARAAYERITEGRR